MDNSKFISFKELASKYGKDQKQLNAIGTLRSMFADGTVGVIPKNGDYFRKGNYGGLSVLIGDGTTNRFINLSEKVADQVNDGSMNLKKLLDLPIFEIEYFLKDTDGVKTTTLKKDIRIGSEGSGGQEKPLTLASLLAKLEEAPVGVTGAPVAEKI